MKIVGEDLCITNTNYGKLLRYFALYSFSPVQPPLTQMTEALSYRLPLKTALSSWRRPLTGEMEDFSGILVQIFKSFPAHASAPESMNGGIITPWYMERGL